MYGPAGRFSAGRWTGILRRGRGRRLLGERVKKQHHTLTTLVRGLLESGFQITDLAEPQPPEEMIDLPGMADELRRPMMLLICAKKL